MLPRRSSVLPEWSGGRSVLFGHSFRQPGMGANALPMASRSTNSVSLHRVCVKPAFPSGDLRLVSLLPSATEMVCALGLIEQLLGVTHHCDYPPGIPGKRQVVHGNLPAVRNNRVFAVDGGYISRPGPRVIDGTELLAHLFHPGLCFWDGPSEAFIPINGSFETAEAFAMARQV